MPRRGKIFKPSLAETKKAKVKRNKSKRSPLSQAAYGGSGKEDARTIGQILGR